MAKECSDSEILRARWHDYRAPGCYLITMVTEGRERLLGTLEGDSEETAAIRLSEIGKTLEDAILHDIETQFPEVEVIKHIVMEDHCHIALRVKTHMQKHLGVIVGMLKTVTTKAYLNERSLRENRLCLTKLTKARDIQRQQERINALQIWLANGAAEPPLTKQYEIAHAISLTIAAKQGIPAASAPCGFAAPVSCGSAVPAPCCPAAPVSCGSATSAAASLPAVPIAYVSLLWAKGYHDRIVTRMGQVAKQKLYIDRNPSRLWLKRHADHAFTKVSNLRLNIPLPLAQQLKDFAVYWDQRRTVIHSQYTHRHDGTHYSESYVGLTQKFLRRCAITPVLGSAIQDSSVIPAFIPYGSATSASSTSAPSSQQWQAFIKFKSCGNQLLLFSPRPFVRIRISRSVTKEQFDADVARILDLCEREGAIAVSPFRSWSEKAMLHLLRMNGYDHIIIHGESMWDGWKPQDGSQSSHQQQLPSWFTTTYRPLLSTAINGDMAEVYAGHCLFLSLWPDRPKGEKVGKADCEIMNEVARLIEMQNDFVE